MSKSFIEFALEVLESSKKPLPFKELFDLTLKASELSLTSDEVRSTMSRFYTDLTTDSRFTNLEGNQWDLRSRHTFAEYHVSTDDIIVDDDDEEGDDFDREEQRLQEEELGEESDESLEDESDDLDFDSKNGGSDVEEEF